MQLPGGGGVLQVRGAAAVVITFEMKAGSPILIPIHANKPIGREFANVVASIYAKESTVEDRWKKDGLLLWEKPHS